MSWSYGRRSSSTARHSMRITSSPRSNASRTAAPTSSGAARRIAPRSSRAAARSCRPVPTCISAPLPFTMNLPATVALLSGVDRPPRPEVTVAALDPLDPLYVTNRLVDRRRRPDPDDPALLGRVRSGDEAGPEPTEEDVLDAQRTVVLGDPGSGKSELLRSLATRCPSSRPGVFVRLADLGSDQPREPRAALAAWASRGQTTIPDTDVGPAAIEEGRLHFFLDGLDEVPSARQSTWRL